MRLQLSALFLVGLMACEEGTDDGGASDAGGADAGDSDDAGTATVEGSQETGDDPSDLHDGFYRGQIIVVGSAEGVEGSGETCTGVVELDVAADANPELDGVATCTFSGWLDWLGPQTLALSGGSVGAGGVEGDVSVTIEGVAFEEQWSGTWGDDHVTASFWGTQVYEVGSAEFEVRFDGSFTAHRVD